MPSNEKRDYKWSFKLYPDSTDYQIDGVLADLQRYFHDWAWILHDKDKLEFKKKRLRVAHYDRARRLGDFRQTTRRLFVPLAKPHIHFYGKNSNHCRISKQQIIKYLHLPYEYNSRPEDISPCWDWIACLEYTVHRNAPEKYQYEWNLVRTNIRGFSDILAQKHSFNSDLKILYELLDDAKRTNEPLPYYELVRKMTLRGCTLQYARPSMVERISRSYQYYEIGVSVE